MKKASDRKVRAALKAFSLLEMMVVISIIVIMSSIAVPQIISRRRMARIQAANDGAYSIYVAAQNYLNRLQKRGLNAAEYFGREAYVFERATPVKVKESGLGYLSVNGGVLNMADPKRPDFTNAYYNKDDNPNGGKAGQTHMTEGERPDPEKLYEAFRGIVEYELGKPIQTCSLSELKNGALQNPPKTGYEEDGYYVCYEMNQACESFLIEVYPSTYTVRAVYYTTYRTEKTSHTGYLTDDIFARIYGAHNDLTFDDGKNKPKWNCLCPVGFMSVEKKGGNNLSQEHVSTTSGINLMGYSYSPAYVGQYPIPAYSVN